MTALTARTKISDTYPLPTNADAKAGLANLYDVFKEFLEGAQIDVASASTVNIGGQTTCKINITGTTTITNFGTTYRGPIFIRFDGVLTLTHNATTLILPGGANITTAAGDTCIAIPNSGTSGTADGWLVMAYQRAETTPQVPNAVLLDTVTASGAATVVFSSGLTSTYKAYQIVGVDVAPSTDNVDLEFNISEDGGSTWRGTSGDYYWMQQTIDAAGTTGNAASKTSGGINMGAGFGNAATESGLIDILIQNPAGTTYHKNLRFKAEYVKASGDSVMLDGGATVRRTAAFNAIRIRMSSGNINGTFKLYGLL